jgi:hypothetical protein
MNPLPRCALCSDVIGLYEPLVVVDAGGTRQSSLAAEPHLAHAHDQRHVYHDACHAAADAAALTRNGGTPPDRA